MTDYIGCDYAQARLESLVDDELPVDEQVAVESHVRWCRTCAARIEDFQLIGQSVRRRVSLLRVDDEAERRAEAVEAGVLGRICAERDQAPLTRMREQLMDLRLVLPAAGATLAVMLAVGVALAMLQLTSVEVQAESLAARIEMMASPGSELNPRRPDDRNRGFVESRFNRYVPGNHAGGISVPRTVVNDGIMLATLGPSDSWATLSMVVGRDGRVSRILGEGSSDLLYEAAVQAAVQQTRFAPAQDPIGRPVAVDLVTHLVFLSVRAPAPGSGALLPLPTAPTEQGARLHLPYEAWPILLLPNRSSLPTA